MAATHSSFSLVWIIYRLLKSVGGTHSPTDPEGWRPYECTRTLEEGEEHARIVVGTSCLAVRPTVNFASKRQHLLNFLEFGMDWVGVDNRVRPRLIMYPSR